MYQIITLFTLNLHMFYVIITSIKLEKAKKDNNEAPPGLSPSGDLPRPWQAVLPKQPHPAFPGPSPTPSVAVALPSPKLVPLC